MTDENETERELKPEFIEKIKKAQKQKTRRVKNIKDIFKRNRDKP